MCSPAKRRGGPDAQHPALLRVTVLPVASRVPGCDVVVDEALTCAAMACKVMLRQGYMTSCFAEYALCERAQSTGAGNHDAAH